MNYYIYLNDKYLQQQLGLEIYDQKLTLEQQIKLVAVPEETIPVSAFSRCSNDLPGHEDSVLCVCFNHTYGKRELASGSGDTTIRIWDLLTSTCKKILRYHKNWVLQVKYSPNGKYMCGADVQGNVSIINANDYSLISFIRTTSKSFISTLVFSLDSKYLYCGCKNGQVKVIDVVNGQTLKSFTAHQKCVTSIALSSQYLITASEDCKVNFWSLPQLQYVKTIQHAHWVNNLSTNGQFLLQYGKYGLNRQQNLYRNFLNGKDPLELSEEETTEIIQKILKSKQEYVVTASDDNTCKIINLTGEISVKATLTGHSKLISQAVFSPNGQFIATCSFDRTVRLWNIDGKLLGRHQIHAAAVYAIKWSSDSRLLMTCSKDSSCKIISIRKNKLLRELPGHKDEVYAIDWNINENCGCSGGKDRLVKIWR